MSIINNQYPIVCTCCKQAFYPVGFMTVCNQCVEEANRKQSKISISNHTTPTKGKDSNGAIQER